MPTTARKHVQALAAAAATAILAACGQSTDAPEDSADALSVVAGDLRLDGPYVRQPMTGQKITAGYFTIENLGETDDRLIAAESPAAETVELHTHTLEDGVMKMRRIEAVEVPKGAQIQLQPGGLHLMLINTNADALASETVDIKLTFENAGDVTLSAPVRAVSSK
ncbi:MAG: copper chaperone PCu(A)C [Pseudomonadota bacterium]